MISLEFWVTICLGRGDGGDVTVTVDVTEEEYKLLKQCCRDYEDIDGYEGLEDLCRRIEEAAQEENEACMADYDTDEEIDYDSVSYMISMPDEIEAIIEEEDSNESEED